MIQEMTDGEVLRWEVFKTDTERLRYLFLMDEYENCFNVSREDFYLSFNKSPEKSFLENYNYWINLPDNKVYSELEVNVGEYYVQNIYVNKKITTEQIKSMIDSVVMRIKNGERISE